MNRLKSLLISHLDKLVALITMVHIVMDAASTKPKG
jgi:hypothetical protein